MSKSSDGSMLEKMVPVLLVISVGLAFAVGALWQKVTNLEGGSAVAGTETANAGTGAADPNAPAPEVASYTELEGSQKDSLVDVSADDHLRGSLDADVFVIEYSDFECPFCQRFHPTVQQAVDEYGDQIAWVYRHFPLEMLHPNANPAAQASECVAELGGNEAFWTFADALFEGSPASLTNLSELAGEAGVDTTAFDNCFDNEKYADKVQEQYDAGAAVGVTGTPGTVIVNKNGDSWLMPGAVPYATLQEAIDTAINAL